MLAVDAPALGRLLVLNLCSTGTRASWLSVASGATRRARWMLAVVALRRATEVVALRRATAVVALRRATAADRLTRADPIDAGLYLLELFVDGPAHRLERCALLRLDFLRAHATRRCAARGHMRRGAARQAQLSGTRHYAIGTAPVMLALPWLPRCALTPQQHGGAGRAVHSILLSGCGSTHSVRHGT